MSGQELLRNYLRSQGDFPAWARRHRAVLPRDIPKACSLSLEDAHPPGDQDPAPKGAKPRAEQLGWLGMQAEWLCLFPPWLKGIKLGMTWVGEGAQLKC